jgi:Glycosyl transferase family 90
MQSLSSDRRKLTTSSHDHTDQCHRCDNDYLLACMKSGQVTSATIKRTASVAFRRRRFSGDIKCIGWFILYMVSINAIFEVLMKMNYQKLMLVIVENEQHQSCKTVSVANVETPVRRSLPHEPQLRSFPRWGASISEENEVGIAFPPILNFIQTSSPYKGHPTHSKHYRRTTDHGIHLQTELSNLPETLYIIQPGKINYGSFDKPNHAQAPILYNSNMHRLLHKFAITTGERTLTRDHKLNLTEGIMLNAIQTLHNEVIINSQTPDEPRSDVCRYSQWPSLCRNLYPSSSSSLATGNDTAKVAGFPFLAWYGDYIGCNYHNWDHVVQNNDREPFESENVSIPLFTVAADKNCNHTIPFPNFYQIHDSKEDSHKWETIQNQYHSQYPWSSKISKILWRGGLTGRIDNNVTKCPRWKMAKAIYEVELHHRNMHQHKLASTSETKDSKSSSSSALGSDYQDMFDAKVTSIKGAKKAQLYKKQFEHDIGDQPIGRSTMPFLDFQKYRGIIDIDGHSWSGRFGSLLCFNSVVLKIEPTYVEYFYARQSKSNESNDDNELRAWKHYIPIRADFSNIEEMAEFVLDPANDDTLQDIIHNANDWCRQNMITSTIANDMLDVWDRYVELLNVNNEHWTEEYWTEDVQAAILNDRNLNMVPLDISDYLFSTQLPVESQ